MCGNDCASSDRGTLLGRLRLLARQGLQHVAPLLLIALLVAGASHIEAKTPQIADVASILVAPVLRTKEGGQVDFKISVHATNPVSPSSWIAISGLPTGITLSAGRRVLGGLWRIRYSELAELVIRIPPGTVGNWELNVTLASDSFVLLAATTLMLTVEAAPSLSPPGETQLRADESREARLLAAEAGAEDARKAEAQRLAEAKAEQSRKAQDVAERLAAELRA